ncbi:MAG: hypothetical protein VB144_08800 [Clostridia bacterium]|nr:hypothetical protein [Clostridia bacterium]
MNSITIVSAIPQLVDRLFKENMSGDHEVTLHDIEVSAKLAMHQIGELLLQAQIDEMGSGYVGSTMPCECGGTLRFAGDRSRTLTTWCGQITYKRAYYHCKRCGASRVPLDEQLGVPQGISAT